MDEKWNPALNGQKPHNLLLFIQMKVHETKRKGSGYMCSEQLEEDQNC